MSYESHRRVEFDNNRKEPNSGPIDYTGAIVREMWSRNLRRTLFEPSVGAGPAWTMLLELFVAFQEKRYILACDLVSVSGVRHAVAHRYLDHLEHTGMVRRTRPVSDDGADEVELTPEAQRRVMAYVAADRTAETATPEERAELFQKMRVRENRTILPWRRSVDYLDRGGLG